MLTKEMKTATRGLHFPGPCMSRLLGISLIEYYNLNHGLLEEITDTGGRSIYRLRIDEDNDPAVLRKLKTDDMLTLHFSVQEVNAIKSLIF